MWMPGKQNHFHVRLSDFSFYSITTGKNTAIGGERQDTEWVLTWQPKSRAFAYLNSLLCGSLHVEACLCVRVWLYLLCVCVPVCMSLQHPTMKINLQREMRLITVACKVKIHFIVPFREWGAMNVTVSNLTNALSFGWCFKKQRILW